MVAGTTGDEVIGTAVIGELVIGTIAGVAVGLLVVTIGDGCGVRGRTGLTEGTLVGIRIGETVGGSVGEIGVFVGRMGGFVGSAMGTLVGFDSTVQKT